MKRSKQKGITLIALVITIIVLLILAGVTIATLTGENGILSQANTAKERTVVGTEKEQLNMAISESMVKRYVPTEDDENYALLQSELDEIVGDGKTYVNMNPEIIEETFLVIKVTFLDTGNSYHVKFDRGSNNEVAGMEILTDEEYEGYIENAFESAKNQTTEDLESLTPDQQQKLESGFKAEINSENGIISINVDEEGIIDWGDGTYSKVKEMVYGSLGKVASANPEISLAGTEVAMIVKTPLYHKYNERNKTYNIKIYAKEIYMENSTALEKITDWGKNEMERLSFAGCINLKEIVPLGVNSFVGESFLSVFEDCKNLKVLPQNFFENASNIQDVSYAFSGCTSLTGEAMDLWTGGNIRGIKCYEGCTKLSNYNSIPEEWK